MADDQGLLGWTKLVITVVGSTIVAAAALYQYVYTSSQTARQPFLERHSALCFQASETAARLATTQQADQWQKSWDDFWMLYWGPLAIVENEANQPSKTSTFAEVAEAMIVFGNLIKPLGRSSTKLPADKLQVPAIHISQSCQRLVTSWWETGIISKWFDWLTR
jgi:hypothetical protein